MDWSKHGEGDETMTKDELVKLFERAAIYAKTHDRANPGNIGRESLASQDAQKFAMLADALAMNKLEIVEPQP